MEFGLLAFQASLFDPLQLLQPCVIPVKLAVQKLWEKKLKWSAVIDADLQQVVNELYEQLNGKQIVLPRKLFINDDPAIRYELQGFADSSAFAYGVAVYIIKVTENGRFPTLLITKGRLIPLKFLKYCIARKELLGVVLAFELLIYLLNTFPDLFQLAEIQTDSTTVLHWWRNSESRDRFINNRMIKIKSHDIPLRYVPTDYNPADIISRGCTIDELKDDELYWRGPLYLTQAVEYWPVEPVTAIEDEDCEIAAPVDVVIIDPTSATVIIDATRFSSWNSLMNCLMKVLQFLAKKFPKFRTAENLPATDVKSAEWILICEMKVIKIIQTSKLLTQKRMNELNLFVDTHHFVRKDTRLDKNAFNFDVACPLFLNDCYETRLLIKNIHDKFGHAGITTVVAELRQRFYLPKAIQVVRKVIRNCNQCKREKAKPFSLPPMPVLPVERTLECLPFINSGVDYAGPFNIL
uniref:Integrase zinc-binding domain-containing protein n=1 Tax=Panagrolaimus davidi TaxID=227884 RepID=A0A914P715_9BILA